MHLYGLIGYPLSHSFSKKFFTEKFEKEGLAQENKYELFPIESVEKLPEIIKNNPLLRGINVTIPHKEKVVSLLHSADKVVQRIKACNCIRITDGKLVGYNTDVKGFEQSLLEKWQPQHNKALILGTGGAAKAVQYVLEQMNITYHYVSRKPGVHSYSYEQLTPEIIAAHPLIINTTPLGMYPAVTEAPPIPYAAISEKHYLFDLVYNPETTLFLKKGKEQGATVKNGYDMLVIQAEESWKIWHSEK